MSTGIGYPAPRGERGAGTQCKIGRFVALDSLRGMAALLVVLLHLDGTGPILSSAFVRNGWLAVDFFFVLSGFVLAMAYARPVAGTFPISRFMILRLGRIYPVHAAVLLALLAYELALAAGAQALGVERPAFADPQHSWEWFLMTALLVQAWFPDAPPAWNAQSWSISVELWLYFGLALVMRLAGIRGIYWILAASLAAIAIVVSGFEDHFAPLTWEMTRGIAGFGIGVGTWRLYELLRVPLASAPDWLFSVAEAIAAVAVILAIVHLAEGADFLPLVLCFAVLVLVFAADRGLLSRALAARPFVALGVLSYSLYMVQYPIIRRRDIVADIMGFETVAAGDPNQPARIVAQPWVADLFGFLMAGLALIAAYLCWRLVEDPARNWSRKKAASWGERAREDVAPAF